MSSSNEPVLYFTGHADIWMSLESLPVSMNNDEQERYWALLRSLSGSVREPDITDD